MAGAGGSSKEDLAAMMNRLGLREEDLDNVVFKDEAPSLTETTGWLAIARVYSDEQRNRVCYFNFYIGGARQLARDSHSKRKKKHSSKL
jgi:hypothetical protein